MAKSFIGFSGDVNIFKQFLNPNVWRGNLEREIKKATIRNALFLVKMVKKNINDEVYAENSPMTLALKRTKKPLTDQRNLWRAIDSTIKSSFEAEVGIVSNRGSTGSKFGKAKSQINIKDLVELMETGYTITVTKKMKQAIAASLNSDKTKTGKIKKKSRVSLQRLKQIVGGQTFVVPPRPLLTKVWEDPSVAKVIQQNWRMALEGTFKKQGAKGGEHRDR